MGERVFLLLFFNISQSDSPVAEEEVWETNTAQGFSQITSEPFSLQSSSVLILRNKA